MKGENRQDDERGYGRKKAELNIKQSGNHESPLVIGSEYD